MKQIILTIILMLSSLASFGQNNYVSDYQELKSLIEQRNEELIELQNKDYPSIVIDRRKRELEDLNKMLEKLRILADSETASLSNPSEGKFRTGELKVESFKLLPNDNSAKEYPLEDNNGDLCGMVKISLPIRGCVFEGAVGLPEMHGDDYWVYLSPGSKRITIQAPGTETLRIDLSEISNIKSIESGGTYEINLSLIQPQEKAQLVLEINPRDAVGLELSIDGYSQKVEDGVVTAQLTPGEHSLLISSKEYKILSRNIEIHNDAPNIFEIKLKLNNEFVDLGLPSGLLWAKNNIGSDGRYNEGDVFGWGVPDKNKKQDYYSFRKIVTKLSYGRPPWEYHLPFDSENIDLDIASMNWGQGWRMPTEKEFLELLSECEIKSYSSYYELIGPNGNSIYFPKGSIMRYWTGSLNSDGSASLINFERISDFRNTRHIAQGGQYLVRPVRRFNNKGEEKVNNILSSKNITFDFNGHDYVDLGLPSGLKWATCDLGTTSSLQEGDEYKYGGLKPGVPAQATIPRNSISSYSDEPCRNISGNKSFDAALNDWGGEWRIPTIKEWEELVECCEWKIEGERIRGIGPNGNSIYFPIPLNKIDRYWSASNFLSTSPEIPYYEFSRQKIKPTKYVAGESLVPICKIRPVIGVMNN